MCRNFMDRLRPIRRVLRGIEAAQVRWFGRSLLSTLFRTTALVLETVGRKSGQRRQTVLAYHRLHDGDLVIVGGAGGQRRVPDWVANVRANSEVHVVVDRVRRPMTAVELGDGERSSVWHEVRQVWPQIETYEQWAGRRVPVFRLTEVDANGGWVWGASCGSTRRHTDERPVCAPSKGLALSSAGPSGPARLNQQARQSENSISGSSPSHCWATPARRSSASGWSPKESPSHCSRS
jgi:deazaflavin-dependent oxidoreductase (nitroreductase family)